MACARVILSHGKCLIVLVNTSHCIFKCTIIQVTNHVVQDISPSRCTNVPVNKSNHVVQVNKWKSEQVNKWTSEHLNTCTLVQHDPTSAKVNKWTCWKVLHLLVRAISAFPAGESEGWTVKFTSSLFFRIITRMIIMMMVMVMMMMMMMMVMMMVMRMITTHSPVGGGGGLKNCLRLASSCRFWSATSQGRWVDFRNIGTLSSLEP